jgi:hypothetical protein
VRSISVPIAGIVAVALLDNRLSWGTAAGVLVALYCHRLYRSTPTEFVGGFASPPEYELRPGWAARSGASAQSDAGDRQPKWPGVA